MLQKVRSLFMAEAAAPANGATATATAASSHDKAMPGVQRHSNGLNEFLKGWDKATGRRVLDLGCTSSFNLCYFTDRDHCVYSDDLLQECLQDVYQLQGENGPVFDLSRYLRENLEFSPERFDAILLWDLVDYIPEVLVKPLMQRLTTILRPGGTVLSYFHTRDAGPEAQFYRYHIHDHETLTLRPGPSYRLQRVFNNRHVENLFQGYRSIKFFLARDNLREVLATK